MILIKHENFPDSVANLIRHYERQANGETILKFPSELYGDAVARGEWLPCVGNQAKEHRPTILSMDDGIKANALGQEAMKRVGCSWIFLAKLWSKEPFPSFAWKILRHWPKIVSAATSAHAEGKHCRIDVSVRGKISRLNF